MLTNNINKARHAEDSVIYAVKHLMDSTDNKLFTRGWGKDFEMVGNELIV